MVHNFALVLCKFRYLLLPPLLLKTRTLPYLLWIMVVPCCFLYSTEAFAQTNTFKDSAKSQITPVRSGDSLAPNRKTDTFRISKDAIDAIIDYKADDSTWFDIKRKKAYLYGNAQVKYDGMDLKAAIIVVDFEKRELYARGVIDDSTGKYVGRPHFNDGERETDADTMIYNFNTKRGRTYGIVMKEGESYILCNKVLRDDDKSIYSDRAKYTTCSDPHPHFYIEATKLKIIPDKKIIFGPSNLKIMDVPTPLFLPFGIFPIKKGQKSGIITPEYGLSGNFGPYLRNGGYYLGINDYFDEAITGDFYFRGSWRLGSFTRYAKRYHFNGNFKIDFSRFLNSEREDPDFKTNVIKSYGIRWFHAMDPKSNPGTSFNANVNIQKNFSAKLTSNDPMTIVNNQFNSSISYGKSLFRNKANISLNLNHSQNTQTRDFSMTLPNVNFSVQRITPFSKPNKLGKYKFYKDVGISYQLSMENRVDTKDSIFFTGQPLVHLFPKISDYVFSTSPLNTLEVKDQFKTGIVHSVPITLGSYKFLKNHFSFTPTVGYQEYWYFNTIEKKWDDVNDTLLIINKDGFARGYEYNGAVNLGTQIFGTFKFRKGKVSAIRHTISPNFGFSYRPDFSNSKFGFYKEVQVDTYGNKQKYSIFEQGIKGGPGGGPSGLFNYSIGNNIQAKMLKKTDSSAKYENVSWLENLSLGGNYNFLADSFHLSNVSVAAFTTLFKQVKINGNASLDPYGRNGERRSRKLEFQETKRIGTWTSASVQFTTGINADMFKNKKKDTAGKIKTEQDKMEYADMRNNPGSYVRFDIPWSLNVNYSINYTKQFSDAQVGRTFSFSGDINITPKWKVGCNSGYDFEQKKIAYTQISINRNLHCWALSFNWIPDGVRKSFQFAIFANSEMLQSMKVTKQRLWIDQ